MAEEYAIVYLYHIFFTHFSADGNLGCSHALALVTMLQWTSGCMYPFEIWFSLGVGIGVRVQPPRGPTEQEQPGVDRGHQCVQLRSAQQEHGCTGSPAQDPEGRAPTSEQPAGAAPKSRKAVRVKVALKKIPKKVKNPVADGAKEGAKSPKKAKPTAALKKAAQRPAKPQAGAKGSGIQSCKGDEGDFQD